MGLFSSKTRTYVEALSLALVEDTPEYIQQSVLTSVVNQRSISSDLLVNTLTGLGAKATRYYNYGLNQYTYGVPEGTIYSGQASNETIAGIIEDELIAADPLGYYDVLVDSVLVDLADAQRFAEEFLLVTRGWNKSTDVVSNPPIPRTEEVSLVSLEFISDTQIYITYTYQYEDSPGSFVTRYDYETYVVSSVNQSNRYYHVAYYLLDEDENLLPTRYYWFYDTTTETYPTLSLDATPDSPYMPVVVLRKNKTDLSIDDGSDRYKTSKKLLSKIDLDIDELGDAINESPDIGDIENAYVVLGVSTQTESTSAKKYLYNYFKDLSSKVTYDESDYTTWFEGSRTETPNINRIEIKEDAVNYNVELGFLYIKSELVSGSIGDIGDVTTQSNISNAIVNDDFSVDISAFVIRRQVAVNTYDELTVRGLIHVNKISGAWTVDTVLADAVADTDTDDMLIPLNIEMLRDMRMKDRTEIMYDAMRIMIHCRVEQKVQWYQTNFFQFATIIAAVAITIYTGGTASGTLKAAAAWVGSTSLIVGALVLGAVTLIAQYGIAYLMDELGEEFGLILTIAAIAVSVYGTGYLDPAQLTALQSGVQQGYSLGISNELKSIQDQMQELEDEMTSAEQELEEMYEDLGVGSLVDPFLTYNSSNGLARFSEAPEQYYMTRIHYGNMADIGSLSIENFVESNLKLEGTSIHHGIRV